MSNLFGSLPDSVRIVEVSPRDGLQNEEALISTGDKLELIRLLVASGLREVEVASFVRADRVPQLADAEDVIRGLTSISGSAKWWALVPNLKGLSRLLTVRSEHLGAAVFTAASDAFSLANTGMSVEQSLGEITRIADTARADGLPLRAYVSTAFFCPYDGKIAPARTVEVMRRLIETGICDISIGDTIGRATPEDVALLLEAILHQGFKLDQIAFHFHNTSGFALANVIIAMYYGARAFDGSAGGVGGCPFAPGASGNVATEDLVNLADAMGILSGVNIIRVAEASAFLGSKLGRTLPARLVSGAR